MSSLSCQTFLCGRLQLTFIFLANNPLAIKQVSQIAAAKPLKTILDPTAVKFPFNGCEAEDHNLLSRVKLLSNFGHILDAYKYLKAVLRQDEGFFDTEGITTSEVITSVSNDTLIIQDVFAEKVCDLN